MNSITHAVYTESLEGIASNMYARALPPFCTNDFIIQKENIPDLPCIDISAPASKTMVQVNHVLDQAFLILPEFLPLVHSIDMLVHYSAETQGPGQIMILFGQPGSGRKTTVGNATSHYPRVIIHSEYNGEFISSFQVPIVRITTGLEHTVKSLQSQIVLAITEYLKPFTETSRLLSIPGYSADELLDILHTSLLIVDLRYLGSTASQIRSMTDYLSALSRRGISILLIADHEQKMLLCANVRDAFDLCSKPSLEIKPLSEGVFFDKLIAKLWKCLVVPGPKLTSEIAKQLLHSCYGNMALIVRSLKEAQMRALTFSSKEFSEQDLIIAIANCTSNMQQLIKGQS